MSIYVGLTVQIGATAALVQSVTSSQAIVTSPPGPEGFADVTVVNPGGARSTLSNTFQYILKTDEQRKGDSFAFEVADHLGHIDTGVTVFGGVNLDVTVVADRKESVGPGPGNKVQFQGAWSLLPHKSFPDLEWQNPLCPSSEQVPG